MTDFWTQQESKVCVRVRNVRIHRVRIVRMHTDVHYAYARVYECAYFFCFNEH